MSSPDFDTVVRSRRSVRRYQPRPVPEDVIDEILELARYAPSSMGLQPWHFVVVREPAALERLAKIKNDYCLPGKREYRADFVATAPVLVAVCVDVERSGRRERENGVIAATVVLLAAASRGLSGVYMTGYHPDDPGLAAAIANELGLPSHVEAIALLPLGFPGEEAPPKTLAPLASHLHHERFRSETPAP